MVNPIIRDNLVNYVLHEIKENVLTSFSSATEVCARIALLQAIQFVTDCWKKVSVTAIQICFTTVIFVLVSLLQPWAIDCYVYWLSNPNKIIKTCHKIYPAKLIYRTKNKRVLQKSTNRDLGICLIE